MDENTLTDLLTKQQEQITQMNLDNTMLRARIDGLEYNLKRIKAEDVYHDTTTNVLQKMNNLEYKLSHVIDSNITGIVKVLTIMMKIVMKDQFDEQDRNQILTKLVENLYNDRSIFLSEQPMLYRNEMTCEDMVRMIASLMDEPVESLLALYK